MCVLTLALLMLLLKFSPNYKVFIELLNGTASTNGEHDLLAEISCGLGDDLGQKPDSGSEKARFYQSFFKS